MQKEGLILNFEGYEINKVFIEKMNEIVENESKSNIAFMFKVAISKDRCKANVILGTKVNAITDYPYNIELVIKGNFYLNNCHEEEKDDVLLINASAIMYPYLRSIMSTFTSQLDYEKLQLPVLNFYSIFEKIEKEKIFVDSSLFEDFE